MKSNIFREYDIRGIVGDELDNDTFQKVINGIALYFARFGVKQVALGHDARLSSPAFNEMAAEILSASGFNVYKLGLVPTPVVYHSVINRPLDAGLMITGSHNPANHNGIKITIGKRSLHGEEIQQIKQLAESGQSLRGDGSIREFDALTPYCEDLVGKLGNLKKNVKVVVDCGNGTAGVIATKVYKAIGADVIELYGEPDGNFPNHHPDPTEDENLSSLITAVRETGAELGIAFDGDADRIGAVDELGRIIRGDMLLTLFASSLLKKYPGSVIIGEVKCSQVFYDEVKRLGGIALMERTGHSVIKDSIRRNNAALAGEMSGHIFFADEYYGFDDALYAGGRLMRLLAESDILLSEVINSFPHKFSTPEIRIPCPDNTKFSVVDSLAAEFRTGHKIIDIDGARIYFSKGWALVRPSNTQAVLTLRFEADTAESLAEIKNEVEGKLAEILRNQGIKKAG
jgi:phosphomannomutase/phosphoglucomutase